MYVQNKIFFSVTVRSFIEIIPFYFKLIVEEVVLPITANTFNCLLFCMNGRLFKFNGSPLRAKRNE